jgi:hypothetical protein
MRLWRLFVNLTQIISNVSVRIRTILRNPAAMVALGLIGWCAFPAVFPNAGVAYAQNTNATIRGQVLDPSGALVPNATVVIENKNTGVTAFSGKTDSAGTFVAPQVIPGAYKITVSSPGLRDAVIDNLNATVAQVASVNINMQVGAATEVVTVQAKGEQLDRGSSDISTLISPAEVQNVPLFNRSPENLLAFIPGVTHGGAGDQPNTSQLSINGSRTLNSEMLLNGVSIIVASTGTALALPSPDGIDQFRLLATNAPAEYGRTAGAVLSANTNSGTNVYHGNVYFLMRNEDFDANTFFNKLKIVNGAVTPRPKDRYFQVGGSLGGPVRIPHLYNGRDKTFFFVNYDYTIAPNTGTFTDTVPTAAQRTGDLSAALNAVNSSGKSAPVVVYHPGTKIPYGSTTAGGTQIVGPIDPATAKILAMLPLPNTQGTFDPANNRYTGNWTTQQNTTSHTLRLVARVDEQLTPKDRFSVDLYRYTTQSPNAVNYNQDAQGNTLSFSQAIFNTTWDCSCNNAWLPSIEYTRVWTPSLVMDLNMGFFRNVVLRNPPGAGLGAAQKLGIASLPLNQTPELTSPGFSNIGSDTNTNQVNITNTYTPYGSMTKTFGPHTFKFGASFRKNQFNSYNPASSPEGTLSFDGSITNQGTSGNATSGVADFLIGQVKTGSYEQPMPPTGRRNYNFGVFLQDDWKITPKLTINAGLRYEYESPLTIAHNIFSRFDPTTGVMLVAGQNGVSSSLNAPTPKGDFSPRIGLAYSWDQKTVIRAAFGTFYGTIFQNLGGQIAFPGYDNNISYNNLGTGIAQPFALSQGFPLQPLANGGNPALAPLYVNATPSNPYSISGVAFNKMNPMPLVQQWNLGFQRALPLSLTLEVNYVGNHALHLPYNAAVNVVPLTSVDSVTLANTTVATQNARPIPKLSGWTDVDNIGKSNYNALQVTVQRQFNTRLAILSNYTYAKSMDDGSTIYNFSAPFGTANSQYPVEGPNRISDVAVSNIDAKHTGNIVMVYTTGGPWWLRNWHISPVFVAHTGLPVNITQTNEIPSASQRPNGDSTHLKLSHPVVNGATLQYYDNPSTDPTFALTPSGPVYTTINGVRTRIVSTGFGNLSRDSIRAPGELDFDASVSKDFQLWRELNFQLRLDAFNVINHTNFTQPNSSLSVSTATNSTAADFHTNSSFGQITGTQPNRKLQLSGRFFF